jgi:hypothetical protein
VPQTISRRQFIKGASALAGGAAVAGGIAETALGGHGRPTVGLTTGPRLPSYAVRTSEPVGAFHSRPDLHPPTVTVTSGAGSSDRYFFLGPWGGKPQGGNDPGPLMVDHQAEPVWFHPVTGNQQATHQWATNFRTWTYRGASVLGWWEGYVVNDGFGRGRGVLVDSSYRKVARIHAANGRQMDMHELSLTPQGTALFTCYPEIVRADLSSVGGSPDGTVLNPVFQEVDIRTGRLLFEWRGLDHIPLTDSYLPVSEPFDYMHLNAVSVAPDGHLIVSARHTWSIYKLDRRTGRVIWRLGGKRSDFDSDKRAMFAWQHDARQPAPGNISMFDNGSDGFRNTEPRSRGLVVKIDEVHRKVRLAHEYLHPKPLLAVAMGSVQLLPTGDVIVGWGTEPYLSDFSQDGSLLGDVHMLSGYKSYRSYVLPWRGIPHRAPAVMASRDPGTGHTTLYVSWNGATDQAATWQVRAGPSRSSLKSIGVARRRGFETAIPLGRTGGYFAVTAVDEDGSYLATSRTVSV